MSKVALAVSLALLGAASGVAGRTARAQADAGDEPRATAAEAVKVRFEIPQQALNRALNLFAQQADLRIVFDTAVAEGLTAPAVSGELTIRKALELLLARSKLTYRFMDARTVAIDVPPKTSQATEPSRSAQAGESTGEPSSIEQIAEIVVTGSRLRNLGDGPAPVTTFDRRRIEQLGVAQIADVLNYLPQQPFQVMEGNTFGGARAVQLRGLGLGTTLVLINGRRTVTSALQGGRNFFDLNMLPLAAVERIEVLSESASSVYGADAVGGVVNIILKDHIERPTVDLYYGGAEGGAEEQQASFAFSLPTERLRSAFMFDYFDRDPLYGDERDFAANADFTRFGSQDRRVTTANPGNICSLTGANLPGLSAPCAAVPAGSSGVGLTPADFAATAGATNKHSPFSEASIGPAVKRATAAATAEMDLSDTVEAFGEVMHVDRENVMSSEPATLTAVVPATNPFNPFGAPVLASYRFDSSVVGLREQVSEARAWRGVLGLTGTHSRWSWQMSGLYTLDKSTDVLHNQVDTARARAALAATDPAAALNVFQDGPGGSPELVRSLINTSPPVDRYESEARQVNGFVRGALLQLPAGELEALIGGEVRNEALIMSVSQLQPIDADRDTTSGFVELRVPVFGAAAPQSEGLTLSAAARHDDYDDFGSTFNPQLGLTWRPLSSLLLRASYGTSFRAPSLVELYLPPVSIPGVPTLDPARGEVVGAEWVIAGNTQLEPEESETLSAGFVFTPGALEAFKFAASYWQLEQDGRVVRMSPTIALQLEAQFPQFVVRDTPTPADVAAGRPGRLLRVFNTSVNAGRLEASGVDLEVTYGFQSGFGRFTPSLGATWVNSFESADFPNQPMLDRAGVAQLGSLTVPEWRVVGSFAWSRRGVGTSTNVRYTSSYDDVFATTGLPTGRSIEPPVIVDMQASLDFGAQFGRGGWMDGLVLRAGGLNVFDSAPRFAEVGGVYGYDTSQTDIRGRFLYLKLSKAF